MKGESTALGIIPARADSSRFPRKVIALIRGKPMLQYVWEAAKRAKSLDEVIIATDDEGVLAIARGFGAQAVLTSKSFQSGSDRAAHIARERNADIVVNIQG